MTRRLATFAFPPAAASAVFAFAATLIVLIVHGGIPAYFHDWQWPPLPELLRSYAASKLNAWDWTGLGGPNLGLQVHPYFLLLYLASFVAWPAVLLDVLLPAIVGFGAYFVSRYAEDLGSSRFGAFAAGVVLALSPFTINQIVAGHIEVLAAALAIPVVLLYVRREGTINEWRAVFALAWTGLHVQYLIIAFVLAVVLYGVRIFRASWKLLFVLLTIVPMLWSLLRAGSAGARATMTSSAPWLATQSEPFLRAATGAHYFAHYWDRIADSFFAVPLTQWVYPLLVIGTALAVRGFAWRLAGAFAAATLLLWGTKGPLGVPLGYLVANVPGFSLFRELYHFAIVIPIVAAVALSLIFKRWNGAVIKIAIVPVLIALAVPFVSGKLLTGVSSIYSHDDGAEVLRSAASSAPSRTFIAPGSSPVGLRRSTSGGADPLAFVFGDSVPLWTYRPTGLAPQIIWSFQSGTAGRALSDELAVRGILARADLELKVSPNIPYATSLRVPRISANPQLQPGWHRAAFFGTAAFYEAADSPSLLQLRAGAMHVLRTESNRRSFDVVNGADPRHSWVAAEDWWFLAPQISRVGSSGAMTLSARAHLSKNCRVERGGVDTIIKSFDEQTGKRNGPDVHMITGCEGTDVGAAPGSYAVAAPAAEWRMPQEIRRSTMLPLKVGQLERARISGNSPAHCEKCYLDLAVTWDPGWHAVLDGRDLGSGKPLQPFGIGWDVSMTKHARVSVEYLPQRTAAVLEFAAYISWVVIIAGALPLRLRRTHGAA